MSGENLDYHPDLEPLLDLALLEDLEQRIGRPRLVAVLQMQIEHSADLLTKLRALGPLPDPKALFPIIHQIAGASGTLGLVQLSRCSLEIEVALSNGTSGDDRSKCDCLDAVAKKTIATLLAHYPEIRPTYVLANGAR